MSYTCPRCGMTSQHPRDETEGYCGNCHDWTREEGAPSTKLPAKLPARVQPGARVWADALMCFAAPRLARWTVVVVDRFDGTEYPVESVRLRWFRSADAWVRAATAAHVRAGMTVTYAPRSIGAR